MTWFRRSSARVATALVVPVVLLALWWVLSDGSTSFYWPSLHTIVSTFGPTWLHGRFTSDIVPSVLRLLGGYACALVVGIMLGVFIGSSRSIRFLLEPALEFLRAIPPPLLIPVLILFLGIGDAMKIVVIAFGCTWPILLNTAEGVRAIDLTLRDTTRVFRMRRWSQLVRLTIPGAGPQIAVGARQALSVGLILMVISEMFAARDGVGFTVMQFQHNFDIPQMWTGIVVLGLIGVVLSLVFRVVELRLLRWYYGARRAHRE